VYVQGTAASLFTSIPDDGGKDTLQNVGNSYHTDTVDHPRRLLLHSLHEKASNLELDMFPQKSLNQTNLKSINYFDTCTMALDTQRISYDVLWL
jgi:hypothetical protein